VDGAVLLREKDGNFGADEAGGAGDEGFHKSERFRALIMAWIEASSMFVSLPAP
jgi:hypothetical protein